MNIRSATVTAGLAALLLAGTSAQAAPSFVNAGFEAGTSTGWDLMDGTNTPGWGINYGTGNFFPRLNLNQACGGPYGNNNQGCQFATIGGVEDGGTSSIEQTLTGFVQGNSYTLSWLQSSEFDNSDTLNVKIIGQGTLSQDFSSVPYPGGTQYWFGWETMSFSFIADDPTLTFKFQGYSTPNYEVGVDAFGIAGNGVVPEPATLLLLATGLLGNLLARRHNGSKNA